MKGEGKLGRVLIMAGGTGGHVFPGLALATELLKRGHGVEWLGTRKGIESQLVPEAGLPLHVISVEGIRGKRVKSLLKAPIVVLRSIIEAIAVLRKVKPSLVVGFGGFASGPGGVAAKMLRLPLIIHEQNAVAGTTNKILAKLANKVLCAFPGVLPGALHVGNPVREEIEHIPKPEQRFFSAEKAEKFSS